MFSLAMPIFTLCVRFILFIVSGWCIAEYWQWSCGGFENRCLMICFFSFRQVGGGVWEGYLNQRSILWRELGNAIEPLGSWPCV